MPEHLTSGLDVDEIGALSQRFFDSETASFQEVAGEFTLETLSASLLDTLDSLAAVVERLPEPAFEPQPDDIDGSDVWSAGEIVGHLAEMDLGSWPFWEAVCGCKLPPPPAGLIEAIDRPPIERRACAEVVTLMRAQNRRILERVVGTCNGDERALHFALGPTSVRAAILGGCFHLVDHYRQLLAFDAHAD